ncbi:hypothetical protein ACVVIH_24260 [Chryseobacterium arthrosphaerae]|nr:hypothetical protein [Chryseobacterium arthrosphaerae]QUY56764.1 hypothetical protein I2F65_05340 [Chryseobacterium arthrosphaerae]
MQEFLLTLGFNEKDDGKSSYYFHSGKNNANVHNGYTMFCVFVRKGVSFS